MWRIWSWTFPTEFHSATECFLGHSGLGLWWGLHLNMKQKYIYARPLLCFFIIHAENAFSSLPFFYFSFKGNIMLIREWNQAAHGTLDTQEEWVCVFNEEITAKAPCCHFCSCVVLDVNGGASLLVLLPAILCQTPWWFIIQSTQRRSSYGMQFDNNASQSKETTCLQKNSFGKNYDVQCNSDELEQS